MGLKVLLDFAYSISLHIEVKNRSDDFCFLGNDLQYAVRPLGITEKSGVVEERLAAPHAVADAKLDVLAAEMALRLIQSCQLVDDAVTGSQCIDTSGFDIKLNPLVHDVRVEDMRNKCIVYGKIFSELGVNLIDDEMIEEYINCCLQVQKHNQ